MSQVIGYLQPKRESGDIYIWGKGASSIIFSCGHRKVADAWDSLNPVEELYCEDCKEDSRPENVSFVSFFPPLEEFPIGCLVDYNTRFRRLLRCRVLLIRSWKVDGAESPDYDLYLEVETADCEPTRFWGNIIHCKGVSIN